jgi:hypothetical protein
MIIIAQVEGSGAAALNCKFANEKKSRAVGPKVFVGTLAGTSELPPHTASAKDTAGAEL